jgi:Glycosyltransferase family 87
MGNGMRRLLTLRSFTIALLALGTMFVIVTYAVSRPLLDFIVYWAASHLFVAHHNPYSLAETFEVQRALGWRGAVPLMFLSPPWVLSAIAPLGFAKSYILAWTVWILILVAAVSFSSRLLMDIYFRDLNVPEISEPNSYRFLFAFTFYPVLLSLRFLQLAPVVLLGVAGFLYYEKRNSPWAAGILLSFSLLKPHLLWLVWIVLLARSYRERQWKTLLSSGAVIAVFSMAPLLWDRRVFEQYWELMTGPFPRIVQSGILAGVRSMLKAKGTYWLQYLPPVIGAAWIVFYWRKHRANWSWSERMPSLVTASLLTAPYGFAFDQALLILPIIAMAASAARKYGRLPGNLILLYTALNFAVLALAVISSPWVIVPAPFVVAALLLRGSWCSRQLYEGYEYADGKCN